MKYKVTNIDKTAQIVNDKGGKPVSIQPGESVFMITPPKDSYTFKVEEVHTEKQEKTEEKKLKKEVK